MNPRNNSSGAVSIIALCVFLLGCSESADPVPGALVKQISMAIPPDINPDSEQLALGARIPGFGGYSIDREGRLVILLRNPAQRGVAVAVLREHLQGLGDRRIRNGIFADGSIIVKQTKHEVRDLLKWRRDMNRVVFSNPSVFTSDFDEVSGVITYGVRDGVGAIFIANEAKRLLIPADAVVSKIYTAPTLQSHTLRDPLRPVVGGTRIENVYNIVCTLGFNVLVGSTAIVDFVTASHCTPLIFQVDRDTMHQPTVVSNMPIGEEYLDYEGFDASENSLCPLAMVCRWSDAAIFRYAFGAQSAFGSIAKTLGSGAPGPIEIDHAMPLFTSYVSRGVNLQVNDFAYKMGQTSGWSNGSVTNTCQDVRLLRDGLITDIFLLCQTLVTGMFSQDGDSGSPIFSWSDTGNSIRIAGILSGNYFQADGQRVVFYSSVSNMQDDYNTILRVGGSF